MRRTLLLLLAALALLVVQATSGFAPLEANAPCADCPAMTLDATGCDDGAGDAGGSCDEGTGCDALACRAACPISVGALPAQSRNALSMPAGEQPAAALARYLVGLSGPPDPFPPRA